MDKQQLTLHDGRRGIIRPVGSDDLELTLGYFVALSEESKGTFRPHAFDEVHARWLVKTSEQQDVLRLFAVVGTSSAERAIGYGYLEHIAAGEYASLGLGVADAFHNQGVGSALMDALIKSARERNCAGVRLDVYRTNQAAVRLYSRKGFRITGTDEERELLAMRLDLSHKEDALPLRGMYCHPIAWDICPLTADTWQFADWQWYLELLQSAGCNALKIFLWPTHYYHPDYPKTRPNAWRYEVYRQALEYAQILGMKTYVGFSWNTIPPSVWLAHPEARAKELSYRGIHACWSTGRDLVLPFQQHLVDSLAAVADGFVLWLADPGYCFCEQCQPGYVPYLDACQRIEQMIKGRAQLHLCLWWAQWLDEGYDQLQLPATPGLLPTLLDSIDPQDFVMIHAEESRTSQLARERGLTAVPMTFSLDPEGGNESANILPRPRVDTIEFEVARSHERADGGQFGYRLTPYTQWPTDWLFLQRLSGYTEPPEEVFERLGSRMGLANRAGDFAEAMIALDSFWTEGDPADARRAAEVLQSMDSANFAVRAVADGALVLSRLADQIAGGGATDDPDFAAELLEQMNTMPIFQGLSLDYLWQKSRALPFLQMRLGWFEQVLRPIVQRDSG